MADEHTRILIVDADRSRRGQVAATLALHDEVEEAGADDAIERLHARQFSALLLALDAHGFDALALIDRIRDDESLSHVPIIVVGGDPAAVEQALEHGASLDLPRGFGLTALRKRLDVVDGIHLSSGQVDTLRKTDQFATLGRLSAGLAHELNNPAAAAQRGAIQLRDSVSRLQRSFLKLSQSKLTPAQVERLAALDKLARERAATPSDLESLSRSDRESELEEWLEGSGVPDAWQMAAHLVSLGFDGPNLVKLAAEFTSAQLPDVVTWLSATYQIYNMLEELAMGTERMVSIVKSIKAHSYVNQETPQPVNLNDSLDSTLVMLRSKLRHGINVHREYQADLPPIAGFSSELGQVWTNLMDNAVDAMDGKGDLTVRTQRDGDWVVVEVEDNGPGIPPEIQSKVFDQFFTTKPPGKGTGLGLNIGWDIIVHKHQGLISVDSQPGKTRFQVRLPIHAPDPT